MAAAGTPKPAGKPAGATGAIGAKTAAGAKGTAKKTGAAAGAKAAVDPNLVTFKPSGQGFAKRFDALKKHAKDSYGVTIKTQSSTRGATWQQKHHVAHMFAYNNFKHNKPAKTETGGNSISFDHASDPKTKWSKVNRDDFLRTKANKVPKLKAGAWEKGQEPDKAATIKHIKSMLKSAGIGGGGTAQVAAGTSPCGEPCKCKGKASKHLTGEAIDMAKSSLNQLEAKLKKNKAGALDPYLKKFGLHRPLKNAKKSPEPWHLEAN